MEKSRANFLTLLPIFVILLVLSFAFVGCGQDPKATKIEVKQDTIATEIVQNATLDFSNLVLVVTYDNNTTQEVAKNDEMKFSSIDTSTLGEKILTIEYLGLKTSVKILVTDEDGQVYFNVGFRKPQSITNFESYSTATDGDYAYTITGQNYLVGDDNPFVIQPIITAVDENLEPHDLDYIDCAYTFEVYNNQTATYDLINDYSNIVSIANDSYSFDFTEEAIDNIYRITLQPTDYETDSFSIVVKVVDGYNVHNTKELSVLDNNANTKSIWQEFKTANNISQDVVANAIILHDNMILTTQDIPSAYLYKQGDSDNDSALQGTLRDRVSIYTRDTAFGSTFTLYGNYFSIDASQIPLVNVARLKVLDPNRAAFAHSALISFGRDNAYCPDTKQGDNTVNSVKFVGNANRNEDEAGFGGIYMLQNSSNELTVKNVVASSFQTNINSMYNLDDWENTTRIESTKIYDSFSIMLGSYGSKYNIIKDSILKNSGGPLLLMTHVNPKDHPDSYYSTLSVENSVLETYASGSEAWFVGNKANTAATTILAADQLIAGTSQVLKSQGVLQTAKSFAPNNKANMMILFAAEGNPLANTTPIKGNVVIKDAEGTVIYSQDMNDPTYKATLQAINEATGGQGNKLPFFRSGNGALVTTTVDDNQQPTGLGKVTATGLVPLVTDSATPEDIQYAQNFFSGDHLGLYYAGGTLGVVLGYYDI